MWFDEKRAKKLKKSLVQLAFLDPFSFGYYYSKYNPAISDFGYLSIVTNFVLIKMKMGR